MVAVLVVCMAGKGLEDYSRSWAGNFGPYSQVLTSCLVAEKRGRMCTTSGTIESWSTC